MPDTLRLCAGRFGDASAGPGCGCSATEVEALGAALARSAETLARLLVPASTPLPRAVLGAQTQHGTAAAQSSSSRASLDPAGQQSTELLRTPLHTSLRVVSWSVAQHADLGARGAGLGAECARLRGQWPDIRRAACVAASAVLEAVPAGALQAELLPRAPFLWSQGFLVADPRRPSSRVVLQQRYSENHMFHAFSVHFLAREHLPAYCVCSALAPYTCT